MKDINYKAPNPKLEYLEHFKTELRNQHSYLSHSLSDKHLLKWIDEHDKTRSVNWMVDQFADYILSQGLADEVQE